MELNTNHIDSVKLPDQLSFVLGFEEKRLVKAKEMARYAPDMRGGVHCLYIYAPSLIENSIIGDKQSPLLRILTTKGSPGDIVEEVFLAPQYHKILEKTVTEITIEIRTGAGRLVPFNYGDTVVTLHFKKSQLF